MECDPCYLGAEEVKDLPLVHLGTASSQEGDSPECEATWCNTGQIPHEIIEAYGNFSIFKLSSTANLPVSSLETLLLRVRLRASHKWV